MLPINLVLSSLFITYYTVNTKEKREKKRNARFESNTITIQAVIYSRSNQYLGTQVGSRSSLIAKRINSVTVVSNVSGMITLSNQ